MKLLTRCTGQARTHAIRAQPHKGCLVVYHGTFIMHCVTVGLLHNTVLFKGSVNYLPNKTYSVFGLSLLLLLLLLLSVFFFPFFLSFFFFFFFGGGGGQ